MTYVDGFVAAVPTANKQKFIDHAQKGDSMFVEAGRYVWSSAGGDDVPEGSHLPSASRESGGRRDRHLLADRVARQGDAGRRMQKVMDDRMQPDENPMPFDAPGLRRLLADRRGVVASRQASEHVLQRRGLASVGPSLTPSRSYGAAMTTRRRPPPADPSRPACPPPFRTRCARRDLLRRMLDEDRHRGASVRLGEREDVEPRYRRHSGCLRTPRSTRAACSGRSPGTPVEADLRSRRRPSRAARAADAQVDLSDGHLAAIGVPPAPDELRRRPRLVHEVLRRVELLA